ncbi:MAG TPA: glycosyltransferase [Spirochaetia bacterium]|nr:glycosyltransferase [Spirochaetia bacterium]
MNIGFFTESYLPHVNGVVNLIQSLKKGLEEQGHTVHIFAPRVRGYVDRDKNVHRFPMLFSFGFFERRMGMELDWKISIPLLLRYARILSSLDAMHAHHMLVIGMVSALYAKRKGIPFFFTNHTNYKQFERILPLRGLNSHILGFWLRLSARLATSVISPGEKMKEQLREYGVKGRIRIIPNGVEIAKFVLPKREQMIRQRAKCGISETDTVLAYIGRLSKEKNLIHLLKCLEDVLKERSNVKAILVGDGPMKEELEETVLSMGLKGRVIFTGYISYVDIHNYYLLADIFVTASLSEVFPLTIIEALSSSLAVVAIDAVGTGDIIRNGYNGILVKGTVGSFKEGLKRLLDDEELRRKIGRDALESVKGFSVETCIERHLALYGEFAHPGRERARIDLPSAFLRRFFSRIIKKNPEDIPQNYP